MKDYPLLPDNMVSIAVTFASLVVLGVAAGVSALISLCS